MLIDIGADSYEDAIEIGVKPGQQIVPICLYADGKRKENYGESLGQPLRMWSCNRITKRIKTKHYQTHYTLVRLYKKKLVFAVHKLLQI